MSFFILDIRWKIQTFKITTHNYEKIRDFPEIYHRKKYGKIRMMIKRHLEDSAPSRGKISAIFYFPPKKLPIMHWAAIFWPPFFYPQVTLNHHLYGVESRPLDNFPILRIFCNLFKRPVLARSSVIIN